MSQKKESWRKLAGGLFSLAVLFAGLSFIPFSGLYHFLSQFEADGSFDSLREPVYQTLVAISRILSLLLILTAGWVILGKARVDAWFENWANYSLRADFAAIWKDLWKIKENPIFSSGILLVTLLGIFLRVVHLSDPIAYDEAYSYLYYASRPLRYIITDYSAPNNHILNSLLMALATHLLGNQPWVIRLPAFLAGCLCVPAVYLAARGLYNRRAGILASGLTAISPILISYSVNARGYSLTCLFTLMILAAAAYLRKRDSFLVWLVFVLGSVLGLYTIPVMIYPLGAVITWMVALILWGDTGSVPPKKYFVHLLSACFFIGLLTLLLYTPVITLGTGIRSIISNGVVEPQTWAEFSENVFVKSQKIWEDWNTDLFPFSSEILAAGFFLSLVTHARVSKARVPFSIPALLWIVTIVVIQRVTPWTRVWQFLLIFLFIWASAGWVGWVDWIVGKKLQSSVSIALILVAFCLPALKTIQLFSDPQELNREESPEKQVAQYLKGNLGGDQVIIAAVPENVEIMYYLSMDGIPMSRLYNEDRPVKFNQAFVIVSNRYGQTFASVLSRHKLENQIDLESAKSIFQAKQLEVYQLNASP